ncbi:MAG: hypothetical protein KC503_19545 [Myxococcales bacterium]|nr:hypothetical protein [Myxococcales bacterium]
MTARKLLALALALAFSLFACSKNSPTAADIGVDQRSPDQQVADASVDALPPASGSFAIDGDFDDWKDIAAVADPAGDAKADSPDLTGVRIARRGTRLYLQLDLAEELNLFRGAATTLRIIVQVVGKKSLTIDTFARTLYLDGDPQQTTGWRVIDAHAAPAFASARYELSFDLATAGAAAGDELLVSFDGSDTLGPIRVPLDAPADPAPMARDIARQADTTFRIATYNTFNDGLDDSVRGPPMARVIKAVKADIYCLQEIRNGTSATIAAHFKAIDPHGDGADWNADHDGDSVGRAIVTRGTMLPLPAPATMAGYMARAVTLTGGQRVVVVNMHPKCCGYAGSWEDALRLTQMQGVTKMIADLRAGSLGSALDPFRDAPVVVVGDSNAVGSRRSIDELTNAGLTWWSVKQLVGPETGTWRNLQDEPGAFPPGTLDLVLHSAAPLLEQRNSFVLDTRELDAAALTSLGLMADDSEASDHLIVLADFKL